jgi:predicted alpha/beta superfamily hydrolase
MLMIGFVVSLNSVLAQEPIIINDSIISKVLNEQRKIKICLPNEYKRGTNAKYDVVYITDGETHFDDFLFIYTFAKIKNFSTYFNCFTNTFPHGMRDRDYQKTTDNIKSGGADTLSTS